MKKLARFLSLIPALVLVIMVFTTNKAGASYNSAYLISDSIFFNSSGYTATDIQNFLSAQGSGLATYSTVEDCGSSSGPHYSYYSQYYSCGTTQLASKIVFDASQAYSINPKVILATMQKEQSLVTTPNPSASQLNCAMGYLSCDPSVSGFFHQVDDGTWQFKTYYELLQGHNWWGYTPSSYPCRNGVTSVPSPDPSGNNTNFYYPGLVPGQDVTFYDYYGTAYTHFVIANYATAGLYCYTPHVYPGSSQVYYSGSYNFVNAYETWFGNTTGACSNNEPMMPYIRSFYNNKTFQHIYSAWECDRYFLPTIGFADEGPVFNTTSSSLSFSVPITRLYSPITGDRFWTWNSNEITQAENVGYQSNGTTYYIAGEPDSSGNCPNLHIIFRWYNPNTRLHVWTTTTNVNDPTLLKAGYLAEGPVFCTQ